MQNLCNFLAQPNCIAHLDVSGTDATLEHVWILIYLNQLILKFLNLVVWSLAEGLHNAHDPLECVEKPLCLQKGQGSAAIFQAVLHQLPQPQIPQLLWLLSALGRS
jgi:hypothetical protein